jgi:hypothetical protein
MTNQVQTRVFLLVKIICWVDPPLNCFDDSCQALDVRGADHFRYAAQDGNVWLAVRDRVAYFCILHIGLL